MSVATSRRFGARTQRAPLWDSRETFFIELGLFLLGMAGIYSVNLVGALPGNEIVIFPMLPILLLARGKRAFNRRHMWFYILVTAWLIGTLIADAYNASPAETRLKGTARVIFFALDFTALAVLINNKTRRLVIFVLSIAGVELITSAQFKGEFLLQWKFGISESSGIVALLISSYFYARRRFAISAAISVAMAVLNLKYGFRSQLGIHLVSATLILPLFEGARSLRSRANAVPSRWKLIVLLGLAGGAAYAANASIHYAAKLGLFDESTQAKFESQASGDYGVLVGGRPETLVAIQAIIDRPFIGHGSFPYEPKYIQLKQDIQYEHGYSESDQAEENVSGVIPTHSHLTMAWVESGILGGICWIYIFMLTVRSILQVSSLRPNLAPLYSYILVGFLWDILYSPFGSVNRIWGAYYILVSYSISRTSAIRAVQVRYEEFRRVKSRRFAAKPPLPEAAS